MTVIRVIPRPREFKIPSLFGDWLKLHGIPLRDVRATWVEVDDDARQIRYQAHRLLPDAPGVRRTLAPPPYATVVVQLEAPPMPLPPLGVMLAEGFDVEPL